MNSNTLDVDMRAAAADYAQRGLKIFPLWNVVDGVCACSDGPDCGSAGKHPRTPTGHKQASADAGDIHAWWTRWPNANIGLPMGDNGLAAIDVDPGHGGDDTLAGLVAYCAERGWDLMDTRVVRTGSGGLHLYFLDQFRQVKTARASFGGAGIDTRGRGGYVVAPPSLHACGGRYTLAGERQRPAPFPRMLMPLLDAPRYTPRPAPDGTGPARPTADTTSSPSRARAWALAGLAREHDALAAMTTSGTGRNDALNSAAYKMGRRVGAGLLDETEAYNVLTAAAAGWHGHTPREIDATVRSGLTAGKRNPHDGPTGGRA